MKVNYILLYGTPYLKHKVFGTFEDISKFLINKNIVNYSIFKKLEDKEEVEMIYRDNDIRVLEERINKAIEYLKDNACYENTISELFCDDLDTDSCMELLDILRGKDVSNKDIEYQIYKKELDRELKKVNSIEEFLRGEEDENNNI